jgi:ATP-binding cassette subfamily B protein RaxB
MTNFAGSIADNIAFFSPDMDLKCVSWRLAPALAAVHTDITAMPMAYNTLSIGDIRPRVITAGQKQRILLATRYK